MRLPHRPISLVAAFFAYFAYFFSRRKSTFSTAILTFLVFPSPISIRFRYLDHLVANRMAPSVCLHSRGTRWVGFKQFCTIFPPRIWCLYGPHTFFKCRIKLARPISGGPVILQTLSLAGGVRCPGAWGQLSDDELVCIASSSATYD